MERHSPEWHLFATFADREIGVRACGATVDLQYFIGLLWARIDEVILIIHLILFLI